VIGCEKLCGKCGVCHPIGWAIKSAQGGLLSEWPACPNQGCADCAILDPATLAELLARALVGRGADVRAVYVIDEIRPAYVAVDVGGFYNMFPQVEARAVLARVMALPLDCGPDAALAALTV
jgi:hypothetical protein